jgi:hypothetical protein
LGGLDVGADHDPAWSSLVEIEFNYLMVGIAPGDDDLIVTTPPGSNSGTITWLETGEVIDLFDFAGANPYTFRLGDGEDHVCDDGGDDNGDGGDDDGDDDGGCGKGKGRGDDGDKPDGSCTLHGAGWLTHHTRGTQIATSEWSFNVECEPIPLPPAAPLGLAGLALVAAGRRLRAWRGRQRSGASLQ